MKEKKLPERGNKEAELREYVLESFRKKGFANDYAELIRFCRMVSDEYADEIVNLLGLQEFLDK